MTASGKDMKDPRCDEVIAGEYVLGALSDEDRRKVELRLARDRQFAAIVNRWEENLSTFDDEREPPRPHPGTSPGVAVRAAPCPPPRDAVLCGKVSGGCWNSLLLWRSLAVASLAVAAGLVYSNGARNAPAGGSAGVKPLAVWLVEEGRAPVSLGALPRNGAGEIVVPADMRGRIAAGAVLTVGIEPPVAVPAE